ncbi:MAG: hypothetical protein HZC14_01710 [Candidatus Niyogibacteria bacterium]|nr:hypothetical protein [Candidatus Niyogibacteria bacterium]
MIISSHVVITAAAVAPFLTHPFTAPKAAAIFGIAVLSHYLADAVPHWDYQLSSVVEGGEAGRDRRGFSRDRRLFLKDLSRAALDGLLGMAIAFLMLNLSFTWWDLAVLSWISFSAILPDIASMFFIIFPCAPFSWFYKAHVVHTSYRWKKGPWSGALFQATTVAAIVLVLKGLFRFL